MSEFVSSRVTDGFPRLPLEGHLDLTYRCNNSCRHCWVRLPADTRQRQAELSAGEIESIADQARAMGARRWSLSGGEPLLRDDFEHVFDLLTRRAAGYTLNTNGTLITPKTARLLRRDGLRLISLYGATPGGYAVVTGNPDGFAAAMQGLAYLREARVGFVVQLMPLQANWHEWEAMVALARSLSPTWRIGASWLRFSSSRSEPRNCEIEAQRLTPRDMVALGQPVPLPGETALHAGQCGRLTRGDDRLLARCVAERRTFHIDPYGGMSFCSYIKDPELRYDLRRGSFRDAWDRFIPSIADRVRGGEEYRAHCGSCAPPRTDRAQAVRGFPRCAAT